MANKSFSRQERVADLIQRELALLIQHECDNKLALLVTVSAVRVSRDYRYAKVYVTVLTDNKQDVKDALIMLNDKATHLRSLLAKTINMRTTPEIRFVYDESILYGAKLSALIDEAVKADQTKDKE